jgi:hypothetical protein
VVAPADELSAWARGSSGVEAGVEVLLGAFDGRLACPGWPGLKERRGVGGVTSRRSQASPVSRSAARVSRCEELLSEIVQQVLCGPVQMLGVTVPRITVGLTAVPPEPLPDDA